jgi:hypothetical protein
MVPQQEDKTQTRRKVDNHEESNRPPFENCTVDQQDCSILFLLTKCSSA